MASQITSSSNKDFVPVYQGRPSAATAASQANRSSSEPSTDKNPRVKSRAQSPSLFLQADAPSQNVGLNAAKRHFVGFIRYISNCFDSNPGDAEYKHSALISAAKSKDENAASELKEALKTNVNINHADDAGKNAIMHAAEAGNLTAIHTLIAAGSGLNMQDEKGNTALMLAAKNGHANVVRCLIQWGAEVGKVNAEVEQGKNALALAAENGCTDVVKVLLLQKAYSDPMGRDRLEGLSSAQRNGHSQVVGVFFEGADKSDVAKKILLFASSNNFPKVVEAVLERGTSVNSVDEAGETALLKAIRNGNEGIVKLLIKNGVDVNKSNRICETALMLATQYEQAGIVEALISAKAKIDPQGFDKNSALIRAIRSNNLAIVELLLENGAPVDTTDFDGSSPLFLAAENGNSEIVETLIKHNATVNLRNRNAMSALLIAAKNGHVHIVDLLLGKGAQDHPDLDGKSVMDLAVCGRHIEVVQFLLYRLSYSTNQLKYLLNTYATSRKITTLLKNRKNQMPRA